MALSYVPPRGRRHCRSSSSSHIHRSPLSNPSTHLSMDIPLIFLGVARKKIPLIATTAATTWEPYRYSVYVRIYNWICVRNSRRLFNKCLADEKGSPSGHCVHFAQSRPAWMKTTQDKIELVVQMIISSSSSSFTTREKPSRLLFNQPTHHYGWRRMNVLILSHRFDLYSTDKNIPGDEEVHTRNL